jgi:hypothetical protein
MLAIRAGVLFSAVRKGRIMSNSTRNPIARLRVGAAISVVLGCLMAAGAVPAVSQAEFGISEFTTATSNTDAGAHPDVSMTLKLNTIPDSNPLGIGEYPDGQARSMILDLPPGLVGNPRAAASCSQEQASSDTCPAESQIGVWTLGLGFRPNSDYTDIPVYNVRPASESFAGQVQLRLPFNPSTDVLVSSRTDSDYGLRSITPDIDGTLTVREVSVTLWGVPGAHTRGGGFFGLPVAIPPDAPADQKAFMTAPTQCSAPTTTVTIVSENGETDTATSTLTPTTNCEALPFDPDVSIAPSTSAPDAPTGLGVDLSFPQEGLLDPDGLGTAHLKKATVTLPEGMTINPAAAGGLTACADANLNLKSFDPVTCPDTAKIGSVTATSPLLEETLTGGVYIRSQNSDDPESGEMFRLALVLENEERGLSIRLPGQVRVDKDTGRIETTFDNNPQLPVSAIALTLKDGPRAPLAMPPTCGTKTIDVELTSWGGQMVNRTSDFNTDCVAGLGGFKPIFDAGAVNPVAGVFSPFAVNILKPDRDSALDGVSLKLPTGLLAKVKGNLGTQVGSVRAFAGPGSQPFMLPGTVTLEGAYGDAPYSLRVVVPAKAGPFDLGDVVVRQKVYVDPVTAEVTVVSDPVPTIVKGVPARMQRLDVNVDKPGFMINPTSCDEKEITGSLDSLAGQTAAVKTRFQVGECAALPFKPKLAMRLTGRKQVTTGKHPGVRAQVNQTGVGEAGIKRAKVTLPKSLALDPENAQALCEFEDGTKPDLENHCPAGSIVGRARATTPLLERDLVGNVYFVKNVRKDAKTGNLIRTLPMIVVALRGEIAINLKGESSTTKGGKLVNTFNNVPDAPITKFNLNIAGGQNGILAVTRTRAAKINVCAGRQTAQADMDGQNGRRHDFDVRMKTPCSKRQTKAAKRQAKRAAANARH